MKLLTKPGSSRWFVVVAVCLLIVVCSLHFHRAPQGNGFSGQVQPRDQFKLRAEANFSKTFLPAIITFYLAAPISDDVLFRGHPVVQRELSTLIPRSVTPVYHQRRFLRPPPSLFS